MEVHLRKPIQTNPSSRKHFITCNSCLLNNWLGVLNLKLQMVQQHLGDKVCQNHSSWRPYATESDDTVIKNIFYSSY